jgi:outer membrane protein OmpA-like peptidoglycan-associated protein
MRRLLISTTALSVALMQIGPLPVMAQSMTEDGSIIAEDGTILCQGGGEAPCDLNAVMEQMAADAAAAAEADAAAAAAAAEAEAAAAAEAEAAAAAAIEAQEQAEAAAAEAQAQAEADARAAAEAEAEAAAAAQAQAEAEAAAAAAAAAAVEASEAAIAEEAVTEEAPVEEAVTEETPVEDAVTEEAPVEEAVTEETLTEEAPIEDVVTDEAVTEEAPIEDVVTDEAVTEEAPVEEAVTDEAVTEEAPVEEAVTDEAVTEEAPVEEIVTDEVVTEDAVVEAVTDPAILVDPSAPEAPTDEAIETLSELLATPEGVDPEALGEAAALAPVEVTEGQPVVITEAPDATDVIVQEITTDSVRSSAQDFAAPASADLAAAAAASNDDDGLTDLQKFGLVALGALAVGAIINANRDQVVSNTGDRVVVQRGNGDYYLYRDDDTLLRRPGSNVRTETFRDGSTRTIVERGDGTQVVTIRDATGRVLRRATYDDLGREIVLIDDLYPEERINVATLPPPRGRVISLSTSEEDALLRARMAALDAEELGRSFSLRQIRDIPQVRQLAATVDVNSITFDSGSAAIKAEQAESLASLGRFMQSMIRENPNEIFLIEGHTDAVGPAALNLTLSDRRAESVALALTEYFDVPPENLVVQGYGESDLRINTDQAERQNRRVAVRVITPLLRSAELR